MHMQHQQSPKAVMNQHLMNTIPPLIPTSRPPMQPAMQPVMQPAAVKPMIGVPVNRSGQINPGLAATNSPRMVCKNSTTGNITDPTTGKYHRPYYGEILQALLRGNMISHALLSTMRKYDITGPTTGK